jgi:hypothetical protein
VPLLILVVLAIGLLIGTSLLRTPPDSLGRAASNNEAMARGGQLDRGASMSPWENALKLCAELRLATVDFSSSTYDQIAERYRFHLDKVPVGPEPIDKFEAIGGYPPELLTFVQTLGGRTLNSACYFGPRVFLNEFDQDYFQSIIAVDFKVTRDEVRIIGGDHGEGRWVLLTRSGCVFFMEIDDEYGQVPEPCFSSFTNWCRVNFMLGVVETELERAGIDVYKNVPRSFSQGLLTELSKVEPRLTTKTWPYRLLYKLENTG